MKLRTRKPSTIFSVNHREIVTMFVRHCFENKDIDSFCAKLRNDREDFLLLLKNNKEFKQAYDYFVKRNSRV